MTYEELAAKPHNQGRDVIVGFTRSGDIAVFHGPSVKEKMEKHGGMHDAFLFEGTVRKRYLMHVLEDEASWDKDLCYVSPGCEHKFDIVA